MFKHYQAAYLLYFGIAPSSESVCVFGSVLDLFFKYLYTAKEIRATAIKMTTTTAIIMPLIPAVLMLGLSPANKKGIQVHWNSDTHPCVCHICNALRIQQRFLKLTLTSFAGYRHSRIF